MVESPYGWQRGERAPPLEEHTHAKHNVVREYTERYLQIVTQNPNQTALNFTVVDGFAGGGRYTKSGVIVPGSPLLLIETVRTIEQKLNSTRPKGFRIQADFIFVEENKTTFEFLYQSILESAHAAEIGRSIDLIRGDCNLRIDEIVTRIRAKGTAHRSLFLLDQCGWGQVALDTVRKAYHELKWSEVFLTFGVDSLIDYLSDKTTTFHAAAAAELDEAFVRDLVRIRESEQFGWRALIQHGLYSHLRESIGAKYASPFFLMSAKSHRALWFIHLSKHWKARDEIGKIHWSTAAGETDHRGDAAFKPLGFTPERRKDPSQLTFDFGFDEAAKEKAKAALHLQLCDAIARQVVEEGRAPTIERVFDLHCNETPIVSTMLVDAICALRSEGEVVVRRDNGRITKSTDLNLTDQIERSPQPTFPGLFRRTRKK